MDYIVINGNKLPTLVAITQEEQERGLMWKEYPPPIMTFPYKESGIRKFWMKNTISPLDILFCNKGKIISIDKGIPFSTSLIGPNIGSDLVVELPGGYAKKYGLSIGDDIGIVYSKETIASLVKNSS